MPRFVEEDTYLLKKDSIASVPRLMAHPYLKQRLPVRLLPVQVVSAIWQSPLKSVAATWAGAALLPDDTLG